MCIVTSIIGTFFVRLGSSKKIMGALYKGVIATGVLSLVGLWPLMNYLIPGGMDAILNPAGPISPSPATSCSSAAWSGLAVTGALIVITEYYTGTNFRPVQTIAKRPRTGHGTNVIQGLAVSMESTALPALVICVGIIVDLHAGGAVRHRHRGFDHAVAVPA